MASKAETLTASTPPRECNRSRTNLRHLSSLGIPASHPRSARPIPSARTLSHRHYPRRRHRRRGPPLLLRKLRRRVHAHPQSRAAAVDPGPDRAPRAQARPGTHPHRNSSAPTSSSRSSSSAISAPSASPSKASPSSFRFSIRYSPRLCRRRHPLHHRHGASRPPQRHDQHYRPLSRRDLRQV